jgi:hypothetical protein
MDVLAPGIGDRADPRYWHKRQRDAERGPGAGPAVRGKKRCRMHGVGGVVTNEFRGANINHDSIPAGPSHPAGMNDERTKRPQVRQCPGGTQNVQKRVVVVRELGDEPLV